MGKFADLKGFKPAPREEASSLPKIKVQESFRKIGTPSPTIATFVLPEDSFGDERFKPAFSCVIVAARSARAYFEGSFGDNDAPSCVSYDMRFGHGSPGGECAECPWNKFGTARQGEGKACRENVELLVFIEKDSAGEPAMLRVPITSVQSKYGNTGLAEYQRNLREDGFELFDVVTRVSAKKAEKAKVEFSTLSFEPVRGHKDKKESEAFVALNAEWQKKLLESGFEADPAPAAPRAIPHAVAGKPQAIEVKIGEIKTDAQAMEALRKVCPANLLEDYVRAFDNLPDVESKIEYVLSVQKEFAAS